MKRPKTQRKLPNYVKKIKYLANIGALPMDAGVNHFDVLHDAWCAHFKKQRCDCDPQIRLRASLADISRN